METIVASLLSALIAAAPGLLALMTGKTSDEEAKAHALASLASLRLIDVEGIIARERRAAPPGAGVRASTLDVLLADPIVRTGLRVRGWVAPPVLREDEPTHETKVPR